MQAHIVAENQSSVPLVEFIMSPCADTIWGANALSQPVAPGQSLTFTVRPGCYNIAGVSSTGKRKWITDIQVSAGTVYTFPYTTQRPEPTKAP